MVGANRPRERMVMLRVRPTVRDLRREAGERRRRLDHTDSLLLQGLDTGAVVHHHHLDLVGTQVVDTGLDRANHLDGDMGRLGTDSVKD